MALPQYFKFYHSVLSVIQDGRVYTNKEIREAVKMQSNFSLVELMIEYNLGVFTQQTYSVKRIDRDYFSEEEWD